MLALPVHNLLLIGWCLAFALQSVDARAQELAVVRAGSDKPAAVAEGLRKQGRTEQAIRYCEQLLSQKNQENVELSGRQKTDIILQLSLAYVDQARTTGFQNAWQAADEVLTHHAPPATAPASRRQTLLVLQRALNHKVRGELSADNSKAIAFLRKAEQGFGKASQAAEQLRRRFRPGRAAETKDDRFSKRDLQSLSRRLTVQRAETLVRLADRYRDKTDQDDALLQATDLLKPLLGQSLPAELLSNARLTFIRALRKLGQHSEAQKRALQWRSEGSPLASSRLLAEQVLSVAEETGSEAALALLNRFPRPSAADALPRDLAELEILVSRWRAKPSANPESSDSSNNDAMRIQQLLTAIGLQGSAAKQQALQVAGKVVLETVNEKNVASLVRAAEFLYQSDELPAALTQFDRAAAVAFRQSARGRAFELSLTAAAIAQSLGQNEDASQRFRRAALTHAKRPQSAKAHHTALLLASRVLKQSKAADASRLAAYAKMLREHLATWPQSAYREQVQQLQRATLYAQKRWARVIELLRRDPKLAQQDPQTLKQLAGAYAGRLAEASLTSKQKVTLVAEATGLIQPVITGTDNRWPSTWSPLQREMALLLAQIHQFRGPTSDRYIQPLLENAIDGAPTPEPLWKQRAIALRIESAVRAGQLEQASKLAREASLDDTTVLKPLLLSLSKLLGSPADQRPTGELMLALLEPAANADWAIPLRAEALEATGQQGVALQLRQQIARQTPGSADAQERAAQLLSEQPNAGDQEQAILAWKQIEQRSRPGGDRWRRAREARIALLKKLSRMEEAKKLERLTKLLYPKTGAQQAAP